MKKIFFITIALSFLSCGKKEVNEVTIKPGRGDIRVSVSATGFVTPRNRLEVKPPISGRVEKIFVKEGDSLAQGQVIAWMSSTERAAMLDAARAKGAEELKKWEEIYKPAPIVAPLNGFVIKRNVEPGQTVTASDVIVVMADTLIIKAQVDETDIGKLRKNQQVFITIDAYPDTTFSGKIEHIAFESEVINNVTVYNVDILPENPPSFMRSGMSVVIDAEIEKALNVLLIPQGAVRRGDFVLVKKGETTEKRKVKTGITDGVNIEIVEGLAEEDEVILPSGSSPNGTFRRVGGLPGMGGR